jgi:hypothetical protein
MTFPFRKQTVFASLSLVFVFSILLMSLLPLAASAAAQSGSVQRNSSSSLFLAPVYGHFKPKSITVSCTSCEVTVTALVKNNGTFNFVATSCELWYRYDTTSGPWTKAVTCLTSTDFPVTFAAHSKTTFTGHQNIGSNPNAGTYQWKIVGIGTYNNKSSKTHAAKITVIVTS